MAGSLSTHWQLWFSPGLADEAADACSVGNVCETHRVCGACRATVAGAPGALAGATRDASRLRPARGGAREIGLRCPRVRCDMERPKVLPSARPARQGVTDGGTSPPEEQVPRSSSKWGGERDAARLATRASSRPPSARPILNTPANSTQKKARLHTSPRRPMGRSLPLSPRPRRSARPRRPPRARGPALSAMRHYQTAAGT
jgi:hypothetical protein